MEPENQEPALDLEDLFPAVRLEDKVLVEHLEGLE